MVIFCLEIIHTRHVIKGHTYKIDPLNIISMRVFHVKLWSDHYARFFFPGHNSIDTDTICTIKIVAAEHWCHLSLYILYIVPTYIFLVWMRRRGRHRIIFGFEFSERLLPSLCTAGYLYTCYSRQSLLWYHHTIYNDNNIIILNYLLYLNMFVRQIRTREANIESDIITIIS